MSKSRISAELRQRVARAARFRCGYCLTSQQVIGPLLEIDHILPESLGGTNDESNLTLACPMCNSHKADRINAIDSDTNTLVPLFNPHNDDWNEHFAWLDDGAILIGKTSKGRVTILALQMNHPDMVTTRRLWIAVGWHPPRD
jgi:hypothetical protein